MGILKDAWDSATDFVESLGDGVVDLFNNTIGKDGLIGGLWDSGALGRAVVIGGLIWAGGALAGAEWAGVGEAAAGAEGLAAGELTAAEAVSQADIAAGFAEAGTTLTPAAAPVGIGPVASGEAYAGLISGATPVGSGAQTLNQGGGSGFTPGDAERAFKTGPLETNSEAMARLEGTGSYNADLGEFQNISSPTTDAAIQTGSTNTQVIKDKVSESFWDKYGGYIKAQGYVQGGTMLATALLAGDEKTAAELLEEELAAKRENYTVGNTNLRTNRRAPNRRGVNVQTGQGTIVAGGQNTAGLIDQPLFRAQQNPHGIVT